MMAKGVAMLVLGTLLLGAVIAGSMNGILMGNIGNGTRIFIVVAAPVGALLVLAGGFVCALNKKLS